MQSVEFQTTVHALVTPVSVELAVNSVPTELQPLAPPKKIWITVNSVPQGAVLSVDGVEAGTTPTIGSNSAMGQCWAETLVAVSGMEVRVRVAGTIQSLDRNKEKRILLTERDPAN